MTVTQKSKRSPGPIDSWNANLIGEQVMWTVGRAKGHKAFIVGFDFICKKVQLKGDSDDKALENMDFTLPYYLRDIMLTGYRWTEDEYLTFKEKKQRSSRSMSTTAPRTPPKVAKIIAKKNKIAKTIANCKVCNHSIDEKIGPGRRPVWYPVFCSKSCMSTEKSIVIEDDEDDDDEDEDEDYEKYMAAAPDAANLIGCHVVLCNLKDVAKNGTFGFVQSFNKTENKYYVKLLTNQHVMVNRDHMTKVTVLE